MSVQLENNGMFYDLPIPKGVRRWHKFELVSGRDEYELDYRFCLPGTRVRLIQSVRSSRNINPSYYVLHENVKTRAQVKSDAMSLDYAKGQAETVRVAVNWLEDIGVEEVQS